MIEIRIRTPEGDYKWLDLAMLCEIVRNHLGNDEASLEASKYDGLKPCPFCAQAAPKRTMELVHWNWSMSGQPGEHVKWAYMCCNCGARGPSDISEKDARRMWNLRRQAT